MEAVWAVVWPIAVLWALSLPLYVIFVYLIGRLRLTDWAGYVLAITSSVTMLIQLGEASMWWLCGIVAPSVAAYLRARRTVRRRRDDPEFVVQGCFFVGHPGPGVKDWPQGPGPEAEQ